ncbi:MAG: hypothetical protein AAFY81_03225 [Pseudomonadota bacterium]
MSLKWIAFLSILATPIVAFAQASQTPAEEAPAEDKWEITNTVYGWFPGITTTVETPIGEVQAGQSFGDVLETLDLAFLGALEARKGWLTLVGDVQYFDISAEDEVTGPTSPLVGVLEIGSRILIVSGYATYAVVDTLATRLYPGAGARAIDASIETTIFGTGEEGDANFTNDGGWVDALVAAKLVQQLGKDWTGTLYGDVGGFGIGSSSDITFQASASVGYQLDDTFTVVTGYRFLRIEREIDNAEITVDTSGPFLGSKIKF